MKNQSWLGMELGVNLQGLGKGNECDQNAI